MEQARKAVEASSLSPAALSQMQQLFCVQEEALTRLAQERILESLKFEGIHARANMVTESHEDTFQWVFGSDSIESGDDPENDDSSTSNESSSEYRSNNQIDEAGEPTENSPQNGAAEDTDENSP